MATRTLRSMELLFADTSGVYIPQRFAAECTDSKWHNVSDENRAILAKGPREDDDGAYWEAWDEILNDAEFHDADGAVYRLHQDGDCWAYCRDRMTPEEQVNFFGEYEPPAGTEVSMVLESFACYLEYGAEGAEGMTESEIAACDRFIEQYPSPRYIVTVDSALSDEFGECELTGVRGKLVGVLVVDRDHGKQGTTK